MRLLNPIRSKEAAGKKLEVAKFNSGFLKGKPSETRAEKIRTLPFGTMCNLAIPTSHTILVDWGRVRADTAPLTCVLEACWNTRW